MKSLENIAYIDGANLHHGVKAQGWCLDYKRFRVWLKEKHGVREAYLFLGLIHKFEPLYKELREAGFILIFKEVVYDSQGKAKGNCDADLVLHATLDLFEKKYVKAVVVTSDGDYASLVKMLMDRAALQAVVSPAGVNKCSILLKKTGAPITYVGHERLRPLFECKK